MTDPELDSLMAPSAPLPAVVGAKHPQKLNYSHAAMVDLIIANPGITQNALAAHFGYTAAWVSTIFASDVFQDALAERTKEIVDPALRATVETNFKAIVIRSQAILMEKLNSTAGCIPDNLALRALELSSRALGYGAREVQPAVKVDVNLYLEEQAQRLDKLLIRRRSAVTYDHEEILNGETTQAQR
jgi:hypothetical protein